MRDFPKNVRLNDLMCLDLYVDTFNKNMGFLMRDNTLRDIENNLKYFTDERCCIYMC